jgi:hypothetical protein
MNPDTPNYYRPYDSGEDTDGDTNTDGNTTDDEDYDSDNLPDFEDPRIRREEDPRYAIIRAAGPNFNTSEQQLKYMEHAPGAIYDVSTNITDLSSLVYLNPPKTTKTSLFSVKSINRDFAVWPSPFNFKIKTPRIYKNVTKFQLVQISFPNNTAAIANPTTFLSTFIDELYNLGVSTICISTCINLVGGGSLLNTMGIAEQGRYNSNGKQMYTTISVPDGVYTNQRLAAELTRRANNTPPLNIISYNDFKEIFQTTRDISVLFNEPGDHYFSNLVSHTTGRFTKNDIMNSYYSQKHIDSFSEITDKIAFNAYYYPILKELIASNKAKPFLLTNGLPFEYVTQLVNNQFLGLNTDTYYQLCSSNRGTLDNYRKHMTFELHHINKYVWSYSEDLKRFSITHNCLHTSLQNDISNKYTSYYNNEISINGFTTASFSTLKSTYAANNAIFKQLESHLSTQLSNYMLGGSYSFTPGDNHTTNLGTYHISTLDTVDSGAFTTLFNFTSTFGKAGQLYTNLNGISLTFTDFIDYHSTVSSYYNIKTGINSTISTITANVHNKHHEYVSTKYTNIIPHHLIQNKSYNNCQGVGAAFIGNKFLYTPGQGVNNPELEGQALLVNPPGFIPASLGDDDNCMSTCMTVIEKIVIGWYSCLPVNSVIYGLPYRLGLLDFSSTDFNLYSTILSITSTVNYNFLMQINQEQSFNNMDIAMSENYNITNETTGQVKLVAAKILVGGVGSGEVTETAIQNPIVFETPLGKLDRLNFQIYADNETIDPLWLTFPFELGINEWDATFQIDEEVAYANRDTGWGHNPTVPIPNNPSALQYMALTTSNNPNNK